VRGAIVTLNGRLTANVVDYVLHEQFGKFRQCHRNGSKSNPPLVGSVDVAFGIDASGAVSRAAAARSTSLPDADIAACVARVVSRLSFPAPEMGAVVVLYRVMFLPP
jgi:hypothetical protein